MIVLMTYVEPDAFLFLLLSRSAARLTSLSFLYRSFSALYAAFAASNLAFDPAVSLAGDSGTPSCTVEVLVSRDTLTGPVGCAACPDRNAPRSTGGGWGALNSGLKSGGGG